MVYVVLAMTKDKTSIKLKDITRLARLQCAHREAAGFLGIRVSQFRNLLKKNSRVAKAWEEGQQSGLVSLRRKQMTLASHNATMAIFLGKQYLGQRDVVTQEHTGADGGPIDFDLASLSRGDRDGLRAILTRAAQSQESSQGT